MFSFFSFSLCEYFSCLMSNGNTNKKNQYKYWLLTLPESSWCSPEELPTWATYIAGQVEVAPTTGYRHWQLLVCLRKKTTVSGVKKLFTNDTHAEKAMSSDQAREYVLKEETSVAGTRFEFGEFSVRRNSKKDWVKILDAGKRGALDEIPEDVQIRYYSTFLLGLKSKLSSR